MRGRFLFCTSLLFTKQNVQHLLLTIVVMLVIEFITALINISFVSPN